MLSEELCIFTFLEKCEFLALLGSLQGMPQLPGHSLQKRQSRKLGELLVSRSSFIQSLKPVAKY